MASSPPISRVLLLGSGPGEPAPGTFGSTLELVRFVKGYCGAAISVAVSGFPRGCAGEAASYELGLEAVRAQIAAGAERVLAAPVLLAETAQQFVADLDVDCVVQPSLLPLHGFPSCAEFLRVARALQLDVPAGSGLRGSDFLESCGIARSV